MKVIIDHQIFFQNRFGGISKIFMEVVRRLKERRIEFQTSVNIDSYGKGVLKELSSHSQINLPDFFSLYTAYKIIQKTLSIFGFAMPEILMKRERGIFKFSLRKQIRIINEQVCEKLLSNEFQIFHPTYFQSYYGDALARSKTKMVLTVYDLVHELFPEYYGSSNFILKNRKTLCELADHIICISNTTKKDLLRLYPSISEEKVSVIYLAGDLSEEKEMDNDLPYQKYILFVGNRSDYKNFTTLLKSFALVRKETEIHLLCAGGGNFSYSEKREIGEFGLTNFVHQHSIGSDAQLASYYRNAEMFIYPSLYEGFGIPLLEAMSVGCPVLCSQIEVFQEVAWQAAYYFDPKNPNDLKNKINDLLNRKELRDNLIQAGFARVKQFSWNQCADAHILVYESLTQSHAK
ncbi:glycosyltransferase family 4 protein [Leptospira sp. WS60.C2]